MILPAGFPGYEKFSVEHAHNSPEDLGPSLILSLPSLQLHLRSNDYYMGGSGFLSCAWPETQNRPFPEMSVNIDTISGRISDHCYNASVFSTSNHFGTKREKIVIDGEWCVLALCHY